MVSAIAGTLCPRSESKTAKQRSDRLELRMRRACSRIKRCSGGNAIRSIRPLQTIAVSLEQIEEVEFTEPYTFLQSLPHGRLSRLGLTWFTRRRAIWAT